MFNDLQLSPPDRDYIQAVYFAATREAITPNSILYRVNDVDQDGKKLPSSLDYTYRLLPSAQFQFLDHLEIIETSKASKRSTTLAWIAIIVSVVMTGVTVMYGK